jgi:uncharacterized protein
MHINHFNNINDFWSQYGNLIKDHEVDNALMAANCINMLKEEQDDAFYASVKDLDGNVLLALMVPPYPIVLFAKGKISNEAYQMLASFLEEKNIELTSIVAPNHLSQSFVNCLVANKYYRVKELTKMRFFRLEKVKPTRRSSGKLRLAQKEDVAFLKFWIPTAVKEMLGDEIDGEKKAFSMIEEERLYIWEDKYPVSMVAKTRPTFSDITLSMVYTPQEYRKKGYASASVAALSQLLLDEGYRYCTLFTDLANPTANKIYQEIGYEAVLDYYEYDIEKAL